MLNIILGKMEFKKFDKNQRSSFSYWFNHWKAFNYIAWKLGVWQPKYLLHDIEKPWLKLFLRDYKKVQKWHREHNSHHLEYGRIHGLNRMDWLGAIIDWECSRLTKLSALKTAREETERLLSKHDSPCSFDEKEEIRKNCLPILNNLGL